MTTPDPITLLRTTQRQALDRQAELATRARQLTVEVAEVSAELSELALVLPAYRAIITALDQARAKPKDDA